MAASSGNWVLPVGVTVVLAGGALWAVSQRKDPEPEVAPRVEVDTPRPFADMPPEEAPAPRGSGGGARPAPFGAVAPEGLADAPEWKKAVKLAEEAQGHFDAATEAKVVGNRKKLNEEGGKARTLFDQALEATALFEEQLVAEWGETDRQVRDIMRTRNQWFDRTRWLHKSISR